MVFKGEPNQFVRFSNKTVIRVTGKKGFYFDGNGEYETDNDLLIRVLKQHFEARDDKTENSVTDDKPTEEKIYKCKYCAYTTANKGGLLAHYRKEHPKGE